MHCDAAHLLPDHFDFARMHARAYCDAQLRNVVADGLGAAHRPGGPVECREEPVTRGVDFAAAKALEVAPDCRVEALEQIAPVAVSDLRGTLGGPHDIGEHYRGEHAIGFRGMPGASDELLDVTEDGFGI